MSRALNRLRNWAIVPSAMGLLALSASAVPTAAASGNAGVIHYVANPPARFAFASVPASGSFPTPSQCVAAFGLACYTPSEIHTAYNIPSKLTGAGQTIVIVDAYGSPTIQSDLQTFDAAFGLPNTTLNVIYPVGQVSYANIANDPTMQSWASETSLDVEWSHAIAPGATIDLVIAPTSAGDALNRAELYAVSHHLGNVMSMSFGAPEAAISGFGNNLQMLQSHLIYTMARMEGMSVFASAGDQGSTNGYSTPNPLYPASDPLVTSVGGTNLFMSDSGVYQSETVWNDTNPALCPFGCAYGAFGATGGAPSDIFPAPTFQKGDGSGYSMRTTADVAFNASVYTSVLVYLGWENLVPGSSNGFYFFGGTSEGSPAWAAITALADQAAGHPLGYLNPLLYGIAKNPATYAQDFHDITVGDNGAGGPGFSAGTGYDLPTGLGSPNVANLIQTLSQMGGGQGDGQGYTQYPQNQGGGQGGQQP